MVQVWISAAGLCAATLLGAGIGFAVKGLPHRWNDTLLGFCAGVMLAAAILGLILPAAELSGIGSWWVVAAGAAAGVAFLHLIDFATPHLHALAGLDPEVHANNTKINKVLLFVMAIAIHKLPEGIATGVGFNSPDTSDAWAVTVGISLQNIPEGMVIIAPLLLAGVSRLRTLLISAGICGVEVAGVWLGYALGSFSAMCLPAMLSFAGGAMLYVVSDEMIPETHAHGHQKPATYALLVGFMLLLFMEQALAAQ